MRRFLRWSLILVVLVVGVSFLGGSALWHALDLAEDLTIEGRAPAVTSVDAEAFNGWGAYGGDAGGHRYAAADQITPENVESLEIAWTHRTGAFKGREHVIKQAAFQTTPVLVDDALVFCTQFNEVVAVDPGTGEQRWKHDPDVPLDGRPANQFTCRGVAHWQGGGGEGACTSRILTGTVDARLIALDAHTGEPCVWFGVGGTVRIEPELSLLWPGEFQITSAPVIVGDIVVIGSAIGDNQRVRAPAGTVRAFDVKTGKARWSFDPVPRDPDDPARATWAEGAADEVGHANVWSSMSVDRDRGLIFLPTSSASPDFYGGLRAGDNLYTSSIVALDAATGQVRWHFQTVHHDVWDYDVPAQPGLYTISRNGTARDVVAQVTKTGFVFVLDRDTGEPVLPVEERPVPQDGAPGEALSPTQPFPVATPPLVPSRVDPSDAFGITLWDKMACASKIEGARHEGLFTPLSTGGTLLYPFTGGGANWGSTAYDPTRNLLVVNMSNAAQILTLIPADQVGEVKSRSHDAEVSQQEGAPFGMKRELLLSPLGLPCTPPPWGIIVGVDLATGGIVWRRTFGTTEDIAPMGIAMDFGTPNFGGPAITSGGLIFIGAAMDNYLRALDVETGRELWKGRLPAGGQATPMTYIWQGRQYVVIAAGGHGRVGSTPGDHVVAFALPEK